MLGLADFFFFQAEDCIRDAMVTGVQTCALPVLSGAGSAAGPVPRPALSTPADRPGPIARRPTWIGPSSALPQRAAGAGEKSTFGGLEMAASSSTVKLGLGAWP